MSISRAGTNWSTSIPHNPWELGLCRWDFNIQNFVFRLKLTNPIPLFQLSGPYNWLCFFGNPASGVGIRAAPHPSLFSKLQIRFVDWFPGSRAEVWEVSCMWSTLWTGSLSLSEPTCWIGVLFLEGDGFKGNGRHFWAGWVGFQSHGMQAVFVGWTGRNPAPEIDRK